MIKGYNGKRLKWVLLRIHENIDPRPCRLWDTDTQLLKSNILKVYPYNAKLKITFFLNNCDVLLKAEWQCC